MDILEQIKNGNGFLRSAITILFIFIALWFDPRISYIQRDIQAVQLHVLQMDADGTRRSQHDIVKLEDDIKANTERITKMEAYLATKH